MRSAALIFGAASAALAAPQGPGDVPGDVPVNCAKANANYCIASDIILRCDDNAIGTPARCSPNLSGYPPAGGFASCWQSGEETGDAACEKNCVVYAEPPDVAFTLGTDECTPSHTETETGSIPTLTFNTTITTIITTTHCEHGCDGTHPPPPPPPPTNGTWVPTETHPPPPPPPTNGTWVPTQTHPPPPPPPDSTDDVPPPPVPTDDVPVPPDSTDGGPPLPPPDSTDGVPPPPPPPGSTGGGDEPTNVPIPPTTTGSETVPTGAAAANKAGLLLGAAGFFAAYLL